VQLASICSGHLEELPFPKWKRQSFQARKAHARQRVRVGVGLSSAPKQSLAMHGVIGTLDLRTPAEETEFQECEAIVRLPRK
jgi:hypothetical protein